VLYDEWLARDAARWLCREFFSSIHWHGKHVDVCLHLILADARTNCEQPFLVHRVYQLDYSRTDKRFRMLDRLKPREMAERPEGGGGAWHPFVGVQRVAWHSGSGLAAAGLLVSATGSGLCRVDFLEGRWFRDRVPYERVEAMRLEEDVMDVDVDEPED
jgi:transcription factor C subunit 6